MKTRLLLLVSLAVAGCDTGPPPDLVIQNRIEIYYDGFPRMDAQLIKAIQVFRDASDKEAAKAGKYEEWRASFRGAVLFGTDPIHCNTDPNGLYEGCEPYYGQPIYQVGYKPRVWATSLVDELSHGLWERIYGSPGEYLDPKTKEIVFLPEYVAFVNETRESIRIATQNIP